MHKTSWDKIRKEKMKDGVMRQVLHGKNSTLVGVSLEKGSHVERHSHPSEQFSLILSGSLRMIFDDREEILNAGEIIFIPAHEPHAAEALDEIWGIDFFAPRRAEWISKNE
jgi:quercetin dioxygenase-like cupin family protein